MTRAFLAVRFLLLHLLVLTTRTVVFSVDEDMGTLGAKEYADDNDERRRELQQSLWGGCVNPEAPFTIPLIHRGAKTWFCLHVGTGGDWGAEVNPPVSYMRYTFRPEADEFSRFHIPNSYRYFVTNQRSPYFGEPNITVNVASQERLSFLRHYYEKDSSEGGRIFPHLTAIIDVQGGRVRGIAWDDACLFCAKNRCEENTFDFFGQRAVDRVPPIGEPTRGCYLTKQECDNIDAKGGTDCDLNLYVVWTGDDDADNILTSVNSRFSAFQTKQAADIFSDNVPDVQAAQDTFQTTVGG